MCKFDVQVWFLPLFTHTTVGALSLSCNSIIDLTDKTIPSQLSSYGQDVRDAVVKKFSPPSNTDFTSSNILTLIKGIKKISGIVKLKQQLVTCENYTARDLDQKNIQRIYEFVGDTMNKSCKKNKLTFKLDLSLLVLSSKEKVVNGVLKFPIIQAMGFYILRLVNRGLYVVGDCFSFSFFTTTENLRSGLEDMIDSLSRLDAILDEAKVAYNTYQVGSTDAISRVSEGYDRPKKLSVESCVTNVFYKDKEEEEVEIDEENEDEDEYQYEEEDNEDEN
ncbi:hypothetical protein EDC94DRAFT_585107 [Helicostylum pulchrum]|nr:hypothetical protein EDC94DRAFT_585107 [Helicostylum pulchrum]